MESAERQREGEGEGDGITRDDEVRVMAIWDRLRQELDRAGKTASDAVDEGRLRLDLYRARQTADRFAQKLGYAVYRARTTSGEISAEEYAAHANDLRSAEAEISRFETMVAEASRRRKGSNVPAESGSNAGGSSGGSRSGPASDATDGASSHSNSGTGADSTASSSSNRTSGTTTEPPPREPPLT